MTCDLCGKGKPEFEITVSNIKTEKLLNIILCCKECAEKSKTDEKAK